MGSSSTDDRAVATAEIDGNDPSAARLPLAISYHGDRPRAIGTNFRSLLSAFDYSI